MPISTVAYPKVLMVAAEASSSLYAQRLLEHWQQRGQKVETFGIGSKSMQALGFETVGRSEDLAVVGLQEVIAHWGLIKSTFYKLVEIAAERKPDVAVLFDYPDFNLRLAKKLKALGIPVVYYISPQIWAWRQSRVKIIKERVDKMLVLFPFEEKFYQQHNVPVRFVGHPLLDEIDPHFFDPEHLKMKRSRYGITSEHLLLALMPGSRQSELKHHLQVQLQVAEKLVASNKNLHVALLVAPTFDVQELKAKMGEALKIPLIIIKDEPFEMISMADVVLCASGTATLMVGLMEKPMVIMYRMNAFTAWVAKRFVKATRYFGMINLVLEDLVVPELFQEQADVSGICESLQPMLTNPLMREKISSRLRQAKNKLGEKGATVRAAEEIEKFWGPK